MKKVIVVFVFLSSIFCAKAQFSTSLSGEALFPLSNMSNRVDFGFGPAVSAGYTFKNKIGVTLGYEYLWFISLIPDYTQKSEYLSLSYNFFEKGLIPYAGLKAGLFQSSQMVYNMELSDNYFGLTPNIGILFESGIISNLKIDANFSFTNAFNESEFKYLKFGIGVYYFFKK
jgi:hypothetical protein